CSDVYSTRGLRLDDGTRCYANRDTRAISDCKRDTTADCATCHLRELSCSLSQQQWPGQCSGTHVSSRRSLCRDIADKCQLPCREAPRWHAAQTLQATQS